MGLLYQIFFHRKRKRPKSFYSVSSYLVITLENMGKVEAEVGRGIRSDLRRDNEVPMNMGKLLERQTIIYFHAVEPANERLKRRLKWPKLIRRH